MIAYTVVKRTAHSQGKTLFFFILRVPLYMKRGDDGVIQEVVDPFYFAGPLRIEHLRMTQIKGGDAFHFI